MAVSPPAALHHNEQKPLSPFVVHSADVRAMATLTDADARVSTATATAGAEVPIRLPERTSEEFRARVERELAEQREATALRRQEHAALTDHTMAIRRLVASLSATAEKDVAGEEERRVIAASLFEAEAARAAANGTGGAKLPSLPRRVGYSSAAVVDVAAEAKIEQLHQVITHMAAEQQKMRTRLAASEFENGEKSDRISELEATITSLRAQLVGVMGFRGTGANYAGDSVAGEATAPPSRRSLSPV